LYQYSAGVPVRFHNVQVLLERKQNRDHEGMDEEDKNCQQILVGKSDRLKRHRRMYKRMLKWILGT
jgi:hypothetical protein